MELSSFEGLFEGNVASPLEERESSPAEEIEETGADRGGDVTSMTGE